VPIRLAPREKKSLWSLPASFGYKIKKGDFFLKEREYEEMDFFLAGDLNHWSAFGI
jgi:hypothetical protein